MAFKRKRKVYKLDFEGTEYDGLEVKVRGLTTGEYLELVSLSAPGTEGDAKETDGMLQLFASHLISWNLVDEDNNEPIPSTFEGIKTNDLTMNMFIDSYGNVVTKPKELSRAEILLNLCQFFHKLPSEILSEDAEIIQLMKLHRLANPGEGSRDG
jgi:hypothetical protein